MAKADIQESAAAYEKWLRAALGGALVEKDLRRKHEKMAEGPFPFLRATYWRWAETILDICPQLASAPAVVAVGDIHLENFGTWRDVDGRLVWGVNDFDEAAEMPYALDLVRLAASAVLGCPHIDSTDDICENLLKGYRKGLADPSPIVLSHRYAWLRALVIIPEDERAHFWEKIEGLRPSKRPPGAAYGKALAAAMPAPKLTLSIRPRTAGAGSLGRPRWVALAEWRGGVVLREAKAALPSAWTLVRGRRPQPLRCYDIATGRYRAPDPWYAVTNKIVVRRLSPDNRKLDAEVYPLALVNKKMLRVMGRDLAAVHVGIHDRTAAIRRDLARRGDDWLIDAARRAAKFVRREQRAWAKAHQ